MTQEKQPKIRTFVSPEGISLASAAVPANYTIEGTFFSSWQSEMVPFRTHIRAVSPDNDIVFASASKKIYHEIKNPLIQTVISLVEAHTQAGYMKYTGEDELIHTWAREMAGVPLTLTDQSNLPSLCAEHPESAKAMLQNDIASFDAFLEMKATVLDSICDSRLFRYTGVRNGCQVVVFAGADYQEAKLQYGPAFLQNLTSSFHLPSVEIPGLTDFKNAVSDIVSGREKMTMKDYMSGGLIGKMMRSKKAASPEARPASSPPQSESSNAIPKHYDHLLFGTQRTYFCLCLAEKEKEALSQFLAFSSTICPDPSLEQRESDAIRRKMTAIAQQAARNQNLALQKQAELQRMQRQTSRMISENARKSSDAIMDSWNRKMASDSRMSQNRSESVRGVNTYQNSYGQDFEVDVSADHVYENRYGDVYGVSGQPLDDELLSRLNWKKINH